jgi:hypothetical protein
MTRAVLPAAAVVPLTISDRTCEAATGLAPRPWKRALVSLGVPHRYVGRRTLCTAVDWVAAISRSTGAELTPWNEDQIIALASGRVAGAKSKPWGIEDILEVDREHQRRKALKRASQDAARLRGLVDILHLLPTDQRPGMRSAVLRACRKGQIAGASMVASRWWAPRAAAEAWLHANAPPLSEAPTSTPAGP